MPDSPRTTRTSATRRATPTSIVNLAGRIEEDIRAKRLQPGDPYLNAADTAKMLRVGTAQANRALQLLEQRQVLVRRQRSGTFLSSLPADAGSRPRRINVVIDQNSLKTEGVLTDGVLVGIQSVLRQADLKLRFVPAVDDAELVHRIIDEVLQSSQREGFVLVRSSLTVQRLVANSGLPTVIFGTPYPSIQSLPWIDRNATRAGELLIDHLLSKKCDEFVILFRQQVMPGDHLLLDSVLSRLTASGYSNSFHLRCLPVDQIEVTAAVTQILESISPAKKVGILCRSEPLALGTEAARQAVSPQSPAEIVVADVYRPSNKEDTRWPYARMELTPQEIGTQIGEMLLDQFIQRPLQNDKFVIPVRLERPSLPIDCEIR